GIAGAGMSPLAELLLRWGGQVSGCDARPGKVGAALARHGATVVQGHDPAHVADAVAVVTTAAVRGDHPELAAARARGIPVLKRAEALGAVVNSGTVVAVAGTHGKTSTTAMTTAVLEEAGLDPTGFVGGRVAAWDGNLRLGGDTFVVEADEYDRSFHQLRPDLAIVTTVEPDHLDIYGTAAAVEEAFRVFLEPLSADGLLAACVDDPGAARLLAASGHAGALGYGVGEGAPLRAVDIRAEGLGSRFTVLEDGRELGELGVASPGLHNVRNALAAFAAGRHLGASLEAARAGLLAFGGVERRFQVVGEARGITVVDDYAHHPTELSAALDAARRVYPDRRIVAVFQPHLFTRTRDFADAFGHALASADAVWVTDVYAAREAPIEGVSGELVADAVRDAGARVRYHADIDTLPEALAAALEAGDVLLALGAGTIDEASRATLELLGGSVSAGSGR
ncbi:MAG TPA: UDP-N-acetylmuramate--L-alanine ligase, partial [Longimicrobiales bacterium]|nr:UDP-N-acetylmuramate--L-alanine ligase [Longimicrobiales bacterium]